jgi:hypothetical protein
MTETNTERFRRRQHDLRTAAAYYRRRALDQQAEDRVMPLEQATLTEMAHGLVDEHEQTPLAVAREACTIQLRVDPAITAARAAAQLRQLADELDRGEWDHPSGYLVPPEVAVTLGKD